MKAAFIYICVFLFLSDLFSCALADRMFTVEDTSAISPDLNAMLDLYVSASTREYIHLSANPHETKEGNNAQENIDGITLLDQHEDGLLDDETFLRSFGNVEVFYSTPFGDHIDGESRLFAIPAQEMAAYLPVFTSIDRAMEFYKEAGRKGFLIMYDSFASFLETTQQINTWDIPIKFGVIIEPGYYGITIAANALDAAIDMTNQRD